ncbi:hypothetical protein D9M71_423310 [compost metagenome]
MDSTGFSSAGMLLTTKAWPSYTATDCSDCTVGTSAPRSTWRWSATRGDRVPGFCFQPAGILSRHMATRFIFFAPSVNTTSLSSSGP